jgi:hypothetical protein
MVKFLFSLLLLLGTSNALAQICIWDGAKYNSTCWACATGSSLPDCLVYPGYADVTRNQIKSEVI